jgi:hypothetical protein
MKLRRGSSLVVAMSLSALALAACGSSATTTLASSTTAPTTTAPHTSALCPLTGTPAPGNVVPARPAIAMKVDNYSLGPTPAEARPQSGLDYADVIFEEQVEGSITRYAAIFQCRDAPALVGPIRSARWTDVQMLTQLGHPILVHVGGIQPVLDYIQSSALVNLDLGANGSLESNPPGRYAPYDTYTTTQGVWVQAKQPARPPVALFTYSKSVPEGAAVTQVHLDWSGTSDIYWRWNASTGTWLRFYNVGYQSAVNIQPDLLADKVQNQAQNVIVQMTSITYGPWVENSGGGLEAESHIIGQSGVAYVFRSGVMVKGTWSSPTNGGPTRYLDQSGHTIALAPGRTWVEVYPLGAPVVVTPDPTTTTAAG